MPSGRSGGSRGGGGSHFGGSRSGGGSSGGSYRSSHVRGYHNGRSVVFIGTGASRRYMPSGLYSLLSFLSMIVFLVLFSGISLVMAISGSEKRISTIEADYLHYQDMIADADEKEGAGEEGYIIYGTVISRFKSENSDKWYLTYSFVADDGSLVDNGYTYSTYTWEQVKDISAGDSIKLALEYAPSDMFTDSIDYDYKYTTIEDDGDYIEIINNKAYYTKLCTIIGVVALALIVAIVLIRKKTIKKVEDEVSAPKVNQTTHQTVQQPKRNHCRYCGSIVQDGKNSCDNCGAGIFSDSDLT